MIVNKDKGTSVGFTDGIFSNFESKKPFMNKVCKHAWIIKDNNTVCRICGEAWPHIDIDVENRSQDANYVHNLFFLNADVWTEENEWTMSIKSFKRLFTDNEAILFAEWLELEGYHIKGMDDGQRAVIYEKFKNR